MYKSNSSYLSWPLHARPVLLSAGRFPLEDRLFAVEYAHTLGHALHLHNYAGCWRVADRQLRLQPGDVTFSPRGVPTFYDLPKPGYHLCIHFTGRAVAGPRLSLPLHLSLGSWRTHITQRLQEIIRLHQQGQRQQGKKNDELRRTATALLLQELLIQLHILGRDGAARAEPRNAGYSGHVHTALQRLVTLIEVRLAEPMDVVEMADRVGVSQNYLARAFRRRFGMTIQRYRLCQRLELARHLLTTTTLPIGLIARRVGIPDVQHFNKQFRRSTGMNPTTARNMGAAGRQD